MASGVVKKRRNHSLDFAPRRGRTLKTFGVWMSPQRQKRGATMSNDQNDASCEHAQRTHDVMIVSTIALWAMLIGFVPVAALRLFGA